MGAKLSNGQKADIVLLGVYMSKDPKMHEKFVPQRMVKLIISIG